MLQKLKTVDLTTVNSFANTKDSSLPWHILLTTYDFLCLFLSAPVCLLLFLNTLSKWLVCSHLVQSFLNVIQLGGSCMTLQYLYFCWGLFFYLCGLLISSPFMFAFFTTSNSMLSLDVFSIAFLDSVLYSLG